MRKLTKTAAVVASMAVMAMGTTMMASAATEGWVQSGSNWYYYIKDEKASNQWFQAGDDWYFVDDEGKMVTNSFVRTDAYSGESEVLDDSDIHQYLGTDDIDDDSTFYYLDSNGRMVKGWKSFDANNIYASPNSDKARTLWYFFAEDSGRMYVNEWVYSNDKWYALSENGSMYARAVVNHDLVDWDDDRSYYMDVDGAMVKGWKKASLDKIAGTTTKCDEGDLRIKDKWVYGDPSTGVLADEEWKEIGGKWYYFGKEARTNDDTDSELEVYLGTYGNAEKDDDKFYDNGVTTVATGAGIVPETDNSNLYDDYEWNGTEFNTIQKEDRLEDGDKEPATALIKHGMLAKQFIAWKNHKGEVKYFYLGKDGDALVGWKEFEDDYYICGDEKGQLYQDDIALVHGKYYYFNQDAVCDFKYLNNTVDYAVVFAKDASGLSKNEKEFVFYETTDAKTVVSENEEFVEYHKISDLRNELVKWAVEEETLSDTEAEKITSSMVYFSIGNRKVNVKSMTESEVILAYAAVKNKDADGNNYADGKHKISIYKLRTSAAVENKSIEYVEIKK